MTREEKIARYVELKELISPLEKEMKVLGDELKTELVNEGLSKATSEHGDEVTIVTTTKKNLNESGLIVWLENNINGDVVEIVEIKKINLDILSHLIATDEKVRKAIEDFTEISETKSIRYKRGK